MKYKCGCKTRKITKAEVNNYPDGTTIIIEKVCEQHQNEMNNNGKN